MRNSQVFNKENPTTSFSRSDWIHSRHLLWGLFCLALIVRLFYLYEIKDSPFFNFPLIDALFHDDWAKQIIAGDWFSSAQGVFYKAPLYPYFMAVIYKIFGHSYLILRLIQLIMGAVSCWFVYLLGRDYFGKRAGLISFLFASLYGTSIYFEGEMEIVGLHIFLNLLLLVALTKAGRENKNSWWILSGLTLGLSALTVPTVLLFIPCVLHWMFWNCGWAGEVSDTFAPPTAMPGRKWPRRADLPMPILRPMLLFMISTVLVIAPVTIHNYIHEKGFVLISANAGLNFYLGNNLNADKTIAIRPGIVWDHFTAQPNVAAGYNVSDIEENNYWVNKSVTFVKNYPGRFVRLALDRFALFWQAYEIKRNKDVYFAKRYSQLLQLPLFGFGLIAPLGLLGIGLNCFSRRREDLLLFYLVVVLTGVVLFFVTARYRLPAIPILIIFAAYFINWFWEKIRYRSYNHAGYALAVFIFAAFLINYDFWGLEAATNFARSHHNLGLIYYNQDKYQPAVGEWESALRMYTPGDLSAVDTHSYLATAYKYKLENSEKAIEHWQNALKVLPDLAELQTELGWTYYEQGRLDEAIEILKQAKENDPWHEDSYTKLVQIYIEKNELEEIKNVQQQATRFLKQEDRTRALRRLTRFYVKGGLTKAGKREWQHAEGLFRMALENDPDSARTYYNLGLICLNTKRWEQAIEYLQKATSIDPEKAEAFGALGSVYILLREKEKARQFFNRALEINPELELARRELRRLTP